MLSPENCYIYVFHLNTFELNQFVSPAGSDIILEFGMHNTAPNFCTYIIMSFIHTDIYIMYAVVHSEKCNYHFDLYINKIEKGQSTMVYLYLLLRLQRNLLYPYNCMKSILSLCI